MWDLFLFVAWGAVILAGSRWAVRFNRRRMESWCKAVAVSGWQVEPASRPGVLRTHFWARQGPLALRIKDGHESLRLVIAIEGPPGLSEVRIRPQPRIVLGGKKTARDIETGDTVFDPAYFVEGPPRLVSALLDFEMRRLLLDVHETHRVEIAEGEIRLDLKESQIDLLLPLLTEAARRIAGTVDIRERLARNAEQDGSAGVRLHNLLLLTRESPGAPDTVEVLRRACVDDSPEVRLAAALALGAEADDILLDLAVSSGPDAVSAKAVRTLGAKVPFEKARDILIPALRRRRLQTAEACLEAIGRSGDPLAVEVLASVLKREGKDLAMAAARALGETGNPAAEAPLLRTVQREQTDVQVAAAEALGRVGTAASVLPLKEVAESDWDRPELERAARQAVVEIQSRLQGASPGQLSLADMEAGQLSLAAEIGGELSLSERGALPFPETPAENQRPPEPERTRTRG